MLAKPDQPLRCQTSLQLTLLAPLHPVLVLSCFSLLSSRHLCPFWPLLNRELTTVPVHDWFFHWWVGRNPEIGKGIRRQSHRAIILITIITPAPNKLHHLASLERSRPTRHDSRRHFPLAASNNSWRSSYSRERMLFIATRIGEVCYFVCIMYQHQGSSLEY